MIRSFRTVLYFWLARFAQEASMNIRKLLGVKITAEDIPNILKIVFSSLIYSCGFNMFVKSGNLFPGGYSGISRLTSMMAEDFLHIGISFSVIYFTMNIITTLIIWRKIGHKFVIFSILWFTLTSIFTSVIPMPQLTEDPLLISVFGGIISGASIGLALQSNASSGGTDFIAIDLSVRLNRPTWNYIFVLNAVVLVIAGGIYGWNQALYSIIFQYVSKELVSSIHQRYKVTRLQVVTDHPDQICSAVFSICRHGITEIACRGAYSKLDHTLLMMTINNYQLKDVLKAVRQADPKAFITENSVEKVVGNYYQKPLE